MLFQVDPASPLPLWEQVASSVRREVHEGRLAPGARLPAARDLADSLEINVHTVLRGYQALRDEGLIELRRGRGAVVRGSHQAQRLHGLVSDLIAEGRRLGLSPDELGRLLKERSPQ